MKLLEIKNQFRRDFDGLYECENCQYKIMIHGYDDRNFHDNVIPNKECAECGKSTNSLGGEKEFIATKYADSQVV